MTIKRFNKNNEIYIITWKHVVEYNSHMQPLASIQVVHMRFVTSITQSKKKSI
jgi:hypothetical protein